LTRKSTKKKDRTGTSVEKLSSQYLITPLITGITPGSRILWHVIISKLRENIEWRTYMRRHWMSSQGQSKGLVFGRDPCKGVALVGPLGAWQIICSMMVWKRHEYIHTICIHVDTCWWRAWNSGKICETRIAIPSQPVVVMERSTTRF